MHRQRGEKYSSPYYLRPVSAFFIFFLTLYIVTSVDIILHEFAHLVTAKWFGLKIHALILGCVMFKSKVFDTRLFWGPLPLMGGVLIDHNKVRLLHKYKQILIFFSGPMASLLVMSLAAYLLVSASSGYFAALAFYLMIRVVDFLGGVFVEGQDFHHIKQILSNEY